jgi:hypothetical protein
MSVLTMPAPGWYPDPAAEAALRWWDGGRWTEGTHDGAAEPAPAAEVPPAAQPAPASVAPPAPRRLVQPSKTRWASLLAAFPAIYPLVVGMVTALAYAGGAASSTPALIGIAVATGVLALIPAWAFAANDRRELQERGYEPAPALAWMLLVPPFAYLVVRRRVVGP